jgi:thymidylate synthase
MKLITTITYTLEQEYGEDYFDEWSAEGYTKEEAMEIAERDTYQDFIDRIEARIDNLSVSNWSRDNVNMYWEE